MSSRDPVDGMIGIWAAMILFAVLLIIALVTLHGVPLLIALLIVVALAVKSILHYLRSRIE